MSKRLKLLLSVFGLVILCFPHSLGATDGDVNGSGNTDLSDVIAALQICAGMNPDVSPESGEKIGLKNAVLALQITAGILVRVRVPAEWDPHAATWMQWPDQYELAMRPAFAGIINVIQDYEPVHLLTGSESEKTEAEQFLSEHGVPNTNIMWHIVQTDNAWMRDNGPIYITDGTRTWIQNWKFDAWGGNFGADVEYGHDNLIPAYVGKYLGMTVEDRQDYVLERGNLEFNGADTLVLNWDCQDDRNPGMTKAEHEAIFRKAFGVTRIIWAYGHDPEDGTTGHIDGTARFSDSDTIVVADFESAIDFDRLAAECEGAGLEVVRYDGNMNWLVGNGFVVSADESSSAYGNKWKSQLESLYPGRDVHMVDVGTITAAGGGIHCVTNDEPSFEK